MEFIVTLVILGVVAAAAFYFGRIFLSQRNGSDGARHRAEEVSGVRTPQPPTTTALEINEYRQGLAEFRLQLAIDGVSRDVLFLIDGITDTAIGIFESLVEDRFASEFMFTVRRVGDEYLHELLNSYTALSGDMRETKTEQLIESLWGVAAELTRIEKELDAHAEMDFGVQAAFLKAKFFDGEVARPS